MLRDARTIAAGEIVRTDICVVGAGAAGIALALGLRDRSVSITLIESGGSELDPASQQLNQGATTGRPYYPLDECRVRILGGSTDVWGGWCRPLDATDFDERDWIRNSGWPFARRDLDPYYDQAQQICGLAPCDYDRESWSDRDARSLLPAQAGTVADTVFQIAPVRFGPKYGPTLQRARNVDLILHANVVEIEMNPANDIAQAVHVATLAGTRFSIVAQRFILAAGGIENARLLLASRRTRNAGIGNEHDLVGRCFTEHLHIPLGQFRASESVTSFYRPRRARGITVRGAMSFTDRFRQRERLPGSAITLHNPDDPHDVLRPTTMPAGYASLQTLMSSIRRHRRPDRLWHHVGGVLSGFDRAAALSYRKFVTPRPRMFVIGCRIEQLPNFDSRVTLDDHCDCLGVPRPRLQWQLTEADLESVTRVRQLWLHELSRVVGEISPPPAGSEAGWLAGLSAGAHHIGTTRMHRDPRQGVVDQHCRVHGTANLYVAGSSVFPTAGYAPPTLTIVALALRLATHLGSGDR